MLKEIYTKEDLLGIIDYRVESISYFAKARYNTDINFTDFFEIVFYCAKTPSDVIQSAIEEAVEKFRDCKYLEIFKDNDDVIHFKVYPWVSYTA
jgi:hypothetical protein